MKVLKTHNNISNVLNNKDMSEVNDSGKRKN